MLEAIIRDTGIDITRYERVHGGDINQAYCLYSGDKRYFLKVNDAGKYTGMFAKEVNGLNALRKCTRLTVPTVINYGVTGEEQYLLLEWINTGSPGNNFWERFGEGLAAMHKQPQLFFGWDEDNYIGSLVQKNGMYDKWSFFYVECHIMPLVQLLYDKEVYTKQDLKAAKQLHDKLDDIFPPELPSLLHGDLWSGNFMTTAAGEAAIFDPATYYGHREMDIGMTLLFGGFDRKFYDAYNNVYPLANGWRHRVRITQLYPLLVHAVLFGGHYISSAREIMRSIA